MWYIIVGAIVVWILYRKKRKEPLSISITMHTDNSDWEEAQKRKALALKKLRQSFTPIQSNEEVIQKAQEAMNGFITNHKQSPENIIAMFQKIKWPDELKKREAALRKELNKHYKNRHDYQSKSLAIYISLEHAKLLLSHPEIEWKNFAGLQKLQSNWKAEEYFDTLLTLMHTFQNTFSGTTLSEKLTKDINRTFELWNSRNLANDSYKQNLASFSKSNNATEKHFIICDIIEYLNRRYKFNPQYREELIEWCEKDIELYEQFLIESNEHEIFSSDDWIEFIDNPALKQKKLEEIPFEEVKHLEGYIVPRLNSYDVLEGIYEQEENTEKLSWLHSIGEHIGYTERNMAKQTESLPIKKLDTSTITSTIEVPKSGQKGKLAFLNTAGEACSTEDAFKDYMEQSGWAVVRAEVTFWQAMFCLSFWEEIFDGMEQPSPGQDIPHDLFQGEVFYLNRQEKLNAKLRDIKQQNLQQFINKQISQTKGHWTRLLYNGDQDLIEYSQTPTVQEFLARVPPQFFLKIIFRIAQNPNENRAGTPDFIIWNQDTLKMVETKKVNEQIRASQESWLEWMAQENIPIEIVCVKEI